ncbi:histidinol dehydrogenase [Desulfobotulus mexicanus]|uniref:Histidinol dehydrogenase n=1 Tax=Desulfobotulus mexicanus TaxID=2586642 RepID=A0A5Q4VGR5_9BACT|nr:histidinol dehydrogenase [Desulfobotulus mexicanus]TYT76118.1 histidinol dehydrogenase [Desulfobotulus mexicanus]
MEMLKYPSAEAEARLQAIVARGLGETEEMTAQVARILEDVRTRGDEAVLEYTRRFDAPDLSAHALCVTEVEIDAAEKMVNPAFMKALDRAVEQIASFHRRQVQNSWIDTPRDGVMLGQLVKPVDAAGVYVPGATGGMTPLVSSVLMGGIPARIAGVKKVIMTTPPMADGSVNPHLLVAARKVGMDAVIRAGSAWGIAAMAWGTEQVPRVDVIVGPGNIWVTLAKKLVSGMVGIDMIAGPSEILVISDGKAPAAYAAADLLSQAEHDTMASAILVTTDAAFAKEVLAELEKQLANLPRKDTAEASLRDFGAILVVDTLEQAFDVSNRLAPEHLELLMEDPLSWIGKVRNAGAIFCGTHTPEPMGDYIAGPNHVLPTAGTARFASALGVDHFVKKSSLISYTRDAFMKEAEDVMHLAGIEGLEAHAHSVRVRLEKG